MYTTHLSQVVAFQYASVVWVHNFRNIKAKDLKNVSVIELNEKSLTNALQEVNDGKKLWKLFLILALMFLAAEILIIRLFKN